MQATEFRRKRNCGSVSSRNYGAILSDDPLELYRDFSDRAHVYQLLEAWTVAKRTIVSERIEGTVGAPQRVELLPQHIQVIRSGLMEWLEIVEAHSTPEIVDGDELGWWYPA